MRRTAAAGRTLAPRAALCALAIVLAACTANPPPPVDRSGGQRTSTVPVTTRNTLVVGIDDIGAALNPHLVADLTPTDIMVSSLVLPSPFRPVPDPVHLGVTDWVPDNSVLLSATVTSQSPFTIVYKLRDEAQWYDGPPIAAEDFHYLWQQMITQQGVVDPAGYRLIADISSSSGGKTVTVTMKQPYPAWRELFQNLLPSHLMKDGPGGFQAGLTREMSGAQFHIESIDRGRQEILLERNDRFWAQPAKPDSILLRRAGAPAELADSMRSNDAQLAQVHGGPASKVQLAAIPGVRTGDAVQPRELQFVLNGRYGDLSNVAVRRGVLGLLDPQLLATVARGYAQPGDPIRSLVLTPSDPGYAPTAPPRPAPDAAYAQLSAAGYDRASSLTTTAPTAPSAPRVLKDGKPLAIRIGVAETDPTAVAVARTAADELRSAGVDATVQAMTAVDLYGPGLVGGSGTPVVDAVVGWARAGGDPATVLASRFGCPPALGQDSTATSGPTATTTTAGPPAAVSSAPGGAAAPTSTTQLPQPTAAPSDSNPIARAPSNISGVCDPTLQPEIDAALRGDGDLFKAIADAEPRLWDLATTLPIMQDSTVVAAGPGVSGASITGAIQVGPLADAGVWERVGS